MPDDELSAASKRTQLVETAVKFLLNKSVSSTSDKSKREFLKTKGLTEEEIDSAMIQASSVSNSKGAQTRSRVKDLTLITAFIGSLVYGCYKLYKDVFIPYLTDKSSDVESADEDKKSVKDLESKITNLVECVQSQKETLTQLKHSVDQSLNTEVQQLKEELKSVKKLLLNRNQFPQAPVHKPIIPTWLQQETEKLKENGSDMKKTNGEASIISEDRGSTDKAEVDISGQPSEALALENGHGLSSHANNSSADEESS